jgi:two-component system sensor histidine kinase MprB
VTLGVRLTVLAAGAVALAVCVAAAVVLLLVRSEIRDQVDDALRRDARDARVAGSFDVAGRRAARPSDSSTNVALAPAAAGTVQTYAQLVRRDGTVVAWTGRRLALPVEARARSVAAARAGPFLTDLDAGGRRYRVYTVHAGKGTALQTARSLEDTDALLRRLRTALIVVVLLATLMAAALGPVVARAGLRPVRRLTATAESVAATGDLRRRIALRGRDELARLAGSFNRMLEALEAARLAQRRLVADASHELRTPLTSLSTNYELLVSGASLTRDQRNRVNQAVGSQLGELATLVDDLVSLAEAAEAPLELGVQRLDEVVRKAVERVGQSARGVKMVTRLEPSLVRADSAQLERAARNLLDNALKWSPVGGVVEVCVRECAVRVRDHGPGIAAADLPFVFDRFYRAREARKLPGSGLGLALVRQVAEAHGGSTSAENADGGGAVFTLALPKAAQDA